MVVFAYVGVTLKSLGVYKGYFGIIWIYEGYFAIILDRFQKTFVVHTDFNDFTQTTG